MNVTHYMKKSKRSEAQKLTKSNFKVHGEMLLLFFLFLNTHIFKCSHLHTGLRSHISYN